MESASGNIKQELLPGQKHPTPTRGFGDRVFYESLLRQRPDSIMAQEWCIYHGVLDKEEAQRLYNAILTRKGKSAATATSYKDTSPVKEVKQVKKDKKRRISDMDEDVEFDAEMNVGGCEGIGSGGI